jgi:CHAT domain-containing protein
VPFTVLFGGLEVVFVPSGTTAGVLEDEAHGRLGTRVLALGDPAYAAPARTEGTRGKTLARLPATREEAKAVGDVVLLGEEATEGRLRAEIAKQERWHAVHLACHGIVDPDRPLESALALTPDAGDGRFDVLEVFRSRIPADLVVLSACDTGTGKVVSGEGLVGLTRAFMCAGSPRVLCSLWAVDDEATSAFMRRFYETWNPKDGSEGLDAAAALRAAQEFVRSHEAWEHPSYWAAWVLWGLGH